MKACKYKTKMIKVDNKLIKKYHLGLCSPQEEEAVSKWLESSEFNEELILESNVDHKQVMWQNISKDLNLTGTKVVPLYKKVIKYASVACLIMGVFFAGRYSTTDIPIYEITKVQQSTLLVYGGNGTYAKIPGDNFSLQFDGQLKLYNGSSSIKTVKVGNASYTLEPFKSYVLMGDIEKSSLIASLGFESMDEYGGLKGDFSVKVITV